MAHEHHGDCCGQAAQHEHHGHDASLRLGQMCCAGVCHHHVPHEALLRSMEDQLYDDQPLSPTTKKKKKKLGQLGLVFEGLTAYS